MNYPGLIVAAIAFAMVATILFKLFFNDRADFFECVKYCLKPDFFSWLDKDLQRDYCKSLKFGFYISICAALGFVAYLCVDSLG